MLPLVGLIKATKVRLRYTVTMVTIFWSLITLLTAFAQAYWAVALLRLVFGIM